MNTAKWQIIKYTQGDGSPIYRCEYARRDMNIIDSVTFQALSEASKRCKELNKTLMRATQSERDAELQGIWCVMDVSIAGAKRHLCYKLGERSSSGRIKAEFDGLMFMSSEDAKKRCEELNAPLLPRKSGGVTLHWVENTEKS